MLIVPVLDLRRGRAVHARGGDRAGYAPVRSVLAPGRPGDALVLARAYRSTLRAERCYVADLDAIVDRRPQWDLLEKVADPSTGFGGGLLVDAGVRSLADAVAARRRLQTRVVVGTETFGGLDRLSGLLETVGPDAVVLSLDLRDGAVVGGATAPLEAAGCAVAAGVRSVLVLDLGRVGSGRGIDLVLPAEIRRRHPDVELMVGGGVRDGRDLARLEAAGCDAVLVASALHAGGREALEN